MDQATTIAIADAQLLIRTGLRHLLQEMNNITVLFEATDEEELLDELDQQLPDILILDYNHPDQFTLQSALKVRKLYPKLPLLIISDDDQKNQIFQLLESGVNCFITKTCDQQEIKDAIRSSRGTQKFFCTKVVDYLLEKSFANPVENCTPTPLSPREIEVVQLIARGLIAKEIARELHLSTHTVYTHRKNIMKKLQLNTSSELMLYAVSNGLVETSNGL